MKKTLIAAVGVGMAVALSGCDDDTGQAMGQEHRRRGVEGTPGTCHWAGAGQFYPSSVARREVVYLRSECCFNWVVDLEPRPLGKAIVMSPALYQTRSRSEVPSDVAGAGVLRVVSDSRTPVFLTVHASGRRRYGYWQPYDSVTKRGGCYVALPTTECDRLYSGGRTTLGDPLVDPAKTTYRVWPARSPVVPVRIPVAPRPAVAVARALAA